MKKVISTILVIVMILMLSGCIVKDDTAKYIRENMQIQDEIFGIEINDKSSDIQIFSKKTNEIEIEYTNSVDEELYSFEIEDHVLKIMKNQTTVNVDENNIIIKLPLKRYDFISVKTTNGNIELNEVESMSYKCHTENGSISGTIIGKSEEYSIAVENVNGTSNLEDSLVDSENKLQLKVQNGNININFSEDNKE